MDANEVLEKEAEEYLFKNGAKRKYFEERANGISAKKQNSDLKMQDWAPKSDSKDKNNPIRIVSDFIE